MEDKSLSQQESLQLIQQMIETAKQEQRDDGKGWIIWGWLLFAAATFTTFNIAFEWTSTFFFWNVFGIITLVFIFIQIVRAIFIKKTLRVKTYTQDLLAKLNTGFFIFLMLIIVSMNVGVPPSKGFALLLGLYGFWILIYGAALNFKPSLVGAYVTWLLAFITLFTHSFQWVMIWHAVAVLFGYIIPGHIANYQFKKVKREVH
jgi:hypothetical protein